MRRADIPAEDRGDVYRLIFFAWADGGLNWEDETAMRRYAKEMGWQWRRFSRTLAHYQRLCSPDSEFRLPIFLIRNFKQSLPEVSPKFGRSLPEVSAKFDQSLPEVSPKFDSKNAPKSNKHGDAHDKSESRSHSHSQNPEEEGAASPLENFDDPLADLSSAIAIVMGLSCVPVGPDAAPIHESAADFMAANITPEDISDFEKDFYRRKAMQGKQIVLTLKILREDLPGWVRSRQQIAACTRGDSPEYSAASVGRSQVSESLDPVERPPREGVWGQILDALDERVGVEAVFTWFEPLDYLGIEDSVIRLRSPDRVFEELIAGSYADALRDALASVGLGECAVSFFHGGVE